MFLQSLQLVNFKNIASAKLEFSSKINCFTGDNGAGKTNILDAIYYLSFCKSYFNNVDVQNIKHDEDFFRLAGVYQRGSDKQDAVSCVQQLNHRKQFKLNNTEYDRLADHIGEFPLVIITPADSDLIYDGSDARRKYADGVISQFDKLYLDDLINYNKVVEQRNMLLKQFHESHRFNKSSLEIWNEKMKELGNRIYLKRIEFVEKFAPIFQAYYEYITGGKENVSLVYDSQLNTMDFDKLLEEALPKDKNFLYSTAGIHKDDFLFKLGEYPIKKYGSQGQQKSYLISLKLAQFDYTKKIKGYKPILLFDDILDKLDYNRMEKLMKLVADENFGQIFITDTHHLRLADIFKKINIETNFFDVAGGTINPIN